jgi:hypothetical protein
VRKIIVVAIALVVAGLHFVVGREYQGRYPQFVNGYLIDLLAPFAAFLVMGFVEHPLIRSPSVRGLLVFGVGAATETLQYLGVPVFGRTFDPLDYLMFALGTLAGAVFERFVLSRVPGRASQSGVARS